MKEAISSPETSVLTRVARRNIAEDAILNRKVVGRVVSYAVRVPFKKGRRLVFPTACCSLTLIILFYLYLDLLRGSFHFMTSVAEIVQRRMAAWILMCGLWYVDNLAISRQQSHRWRWSGPTLYPTGRFVLLLSDTCHNEAGRIRPIAKFNVLITNRTRDLANCNTVLLTH
jgi:hypothetical protein